MLVGVNVNLVVVSNVLRLGNEVVVKHYELMFQIVGFMMNMEREGIEMKMVMHYG